jgi:4-amino-4-deoxy-L-arabinose transferase-like glycosyltransferase
VRVAWLALLACVLAAAPALLVDLPTPHVIDPHEARMLATVLDTGANQAPLRDDSTAAGGWLSWVSFEMWVPHRNGEARLDLPPGATMLYTLTLPHDPATVLPESLAWRSRLVAAGCALVTVAGVFWAGYSMGGLASGAIAALFFAATPMLVYHGRLASEAMPHLMWATLATATAVWAIRPMRPMPSFGRQALGWLICGLAMGMALLTGGSIAAPLLVLPLAVIVLLCPHRFSHLMGLLAAMVVATLMTLPWLAFTYDRDPAVWQVWVAELTPTPLLDPHLLGTSVGWRGVLVLLALLPWSGWLIASIVQPFSTSSAGSRTRLFLGWSWFVVMSLLMIVAPDTSRLGRMLVIVPAACVMMGQLFGHLVEMSAEGRHARMWRGMRWLYLAGAATAAALIPAVFAMQAMLIEQGWLTTRFAASMSMAYWLGLTAVLIAGVVLVFRWASLHYPGLSAAAAALWMIVLMTTLAIPLARGPLGQSLVAAEATMLTQIAGDRPIYWMATLDGGNVEPDPALLLHVQRRIAPISIRNVDEALHDHPRVYVLSPMEYGGAMPVRGAQAELVARMPSVGRMVWQYTAVVDPSEHTRFPL